MILPLTAAAPRLLTDETCAPAMLTKAEVISRPEVDSAFSTECVIACEAAARSTMMPLRIPAEGSMPTPRIRTDWLSSTRPTSVQTLVVPTSMPTTISSMSFTHPVIGRGRIGHIDQRRLNTSLCQGSHHRFIHTDLQLNISCTRPKINSPAARVIPSKTRTCIVQNWHTLWNMPTQSFQRLHHF